jgi:hypothetical protein
LKKAQQEQQEINEVLLRSIVTKKIPKDDNHDEKVSKRASKNYGPETEKGDRSSEGTPSAEDKTIPDRKIKQVDHLEGEFKNCCCFSTPFRCHFPKEFKLILNGRVLKDMHCKFGTIDFIHCIVQPYHY